MSSSRITSGPSDFKTSDSLLKSKSNLSSFSSKGVSSLASSDTLGEMFGAVRSINSCSEINETLGYSTGLLNTQVFH